MKKVGYSPAVAGAIEAAASTGGQIVPPIMGAGAFIIAEWTGIPYHTIVVYSIVPAILYFFSVAFAKGLYLVPLLFVYTNILSGSFFEVIIIMFIAMAGLLSMVVSIEGYFMKSISVVFRFAYLAVTICCFWGDKSINYIGVALMLFLTMIHYSSYKRTKFKDTTENKVLV